MTFPIPGSAAGAPRRSILAALALAMTFSGALCRSATAGEDPALGKEQQILYELIVKYRDRLAKGVKAQYRITCNALDEDHCSATWLHDCVVKGRFSRVSWLLEKSTPKIVQHGKEASTTNAFVACAISISPQRIEWLDRKDGSMVSYSFTRNELKGITDAVEPATLYPFIEKWVKLRSRQQVSALTRPLTIFNGLAMGGTMPKGGWLMLYDERFLKGNAAKVTVEKASDSSLLLRRTMDDAEFAEFYQVNDTYRQAHSAAEVAAHLAEVRRSIGSFYHRLTLTKDASGWNIEHAETGTAEKVFTRSTYAFDKSGLVRSCVVTTPGQAGVLMQYDLLKSDERVSVADLALDPSEAKSIVDGATGLAIEPQ